VRMTGPYIPTDSRSVRTIYRVFEYPFIYMYRYENSSNLSKTRKKGIKFRNILQNGVMALDRTCSGISVMRFYVPD